MTQKERIEALERKVIELEARLSAQEARPYPYYVYWQPNSYPQYPWYQTTTFSEHNNAGGI